MVHRDTQRYQLVHEGQSVSVAGNAGIAGLLLGGGLFGFFPGQVIDPVELHGDFRKIILFHFSPELGIVHQCILTIGNGGINGADDQHDGHSDEQGDPDVQLRALVLRFIIARIVAIRFHKRYFTPFGIHFAHHITFFRPGQ